MRDFERDTRIANACESEVENKKHGTPEQQVKEILLAWIAYDEEASARIEKVENPVMTAYQAIHDYAKKHRTGSSAYVGPEKSLEIILKTMGVEDPKGIIEGGLMHAILLAEANKYRPHEMAMKSPSDLMQHAPKSQTSANLQPKKSFMGGLEDFL